MKTPPVIILTGMPTGRFVQNDSGQLLRSYPVESEWKEIRLDVSALPAGMYVLKAEPMGLVTKLVKQD